MGIGLRCASVEQGILGLPYQGGCWERLSGHAAKFQTLKGVQAVLMQNTGSRGPGTLFILSNPVQNAQYLGEFAILFAYVSD